MEKLKCSFCNREFSRKESKTFHEKYCKENPNKQICKGHAINDETRKKISDGMKKAHSEGRAHNIGECRWNNELSFPEKWFKEMLSNELNQEEGRDYIREFPFYRFSLDFAWPTKKFCIEVDGEQHQRDPLQKERDSEKDKLLFQDNWIEIRIDWKKICNNTKTFIQILKDCFNNLRTLSEEELETLNRYKSKKQLKQEYYERNNIPVDSRGYHNVSILSQEVWENRKKQILDSGVDLSKFGWEKKVREITQLSHRQIKNTLEHTDLKDYVFQNKNQNYFGKNNSQYNTIWITNGVQNKKINKNTPVPEGWNPGVTYNH